MSKLIFYLFLLDIVYFVSSFNVSPVPNIIFKKPVLENTTQNRSSYFGYSLNLRKKSLMIGAPQAQTLVSSKLKESGELYKCDFDSESSCVRYIDIDLNYVKNHQWLGATMDGFSSETDYFVVCAPRFTPVPGKMSGICYQTPNTTISTARNMSDINMTLYGYGKLGGISVHMVQKTKNVLIGMIELPFYKGEILHYNLEERKTYYIIGHQKTHSSFGYAISSGYFDDSRNLSFVASAPGQGEVYIFVMDDKLSNCTGTSIKKLYTFLENQVAEFFGYTLVTEDFNDNGLDDLVISAPLFSRNGRYENGAVYIFENKGFLLNGTWIYYFNMKVQLMSNFDGSGRFGSAISKIGDINNDGFNDLAVSAPFESNGVVYIYVGGPNGIVDKPYQKLVAPTNYNSFDILAASYLFGFSLSRGVDIDNNQYLDIAIGAPNAEVVFVYQTYPIAKVKAKITTQPQEIASEDTDINLEACLFLESSHEIKDEINTNITIIFDYYFKRATINGNYSQITRNVTLGLVEKCFNFTMQIKYLDAYAQYPIEIEMHYNVLDGVSHQKDFCTKCVAINPAESTVVKTSVFFVVDCENVTCVTDLKLSSKLLNNENFESRTIEYTITNNGEPAFRTKLMVFIGKIVSVLKTPTICHINNDKAIICYINNQNAFYNYSTEIIPITLDLSKLQGSKLDINATLDCAGNAQNNTEKTEIKTINHISVEISPGAPSNVVDIDLNSMPTYSLPIVITNTGLNAIKNLTILLSMPQIKRDAHDIFVNINNITSFFIKGDMQVPFKFSWTSARNVMKIGSGRKKVKDDTFTSEKDKVNCPNTNTSKDQLQISFDTFDLPNDLAIIPNCSGIDNNSCTQTNVSFGVFPPKSTFKLYLNFTADSTQLLYHLMDKNAQFFVYQSFATIMIPTHNHDNVCLKTLIQMPRTIFRRTLGQHISMKLYGYILMLAICIISLCILLLKNIWAGFFKRNLKDDLDKLRKREMKVELLEDIE